MEMSFLSQFSCAYVEHHVDTNRKYWFRLTQNHGFIVSWKTNDLVMFSTDFLSFFFFFYNHYIYILSNSYYNKNFKNFNKYISPPFSH